jgi:hypothetical protein
VSAKDGSGFVGPAELRGALIVGLFRDEAVVRVILETARGPGLTLTFRDVTAVVEKRPTGMRLAGLSKTAVGSRERFVFVNAREGDDARLEVTAAGFEVTSSP